MAKSTLALSPFIVEEFYQLCNWANEVWLNHLELFDHNPRADELVKSSAGKELERLSVISHEYSLLQIVKLHDKAVSHGNITLGINYMVIYGGWSDPVRERLQKLANELDRFADQLLKARNKLLSHNDLSIIVAGSTLGEFAEGDEAKYFKNLQEFVNVVHEEVIGSPRPFKENVKNEVAAFLAAIKPQ